MLTREQADKLLRANVGNVVEKLKAKKTLTKAELALIQAAANEEPLEEARAFVETKVDLAKTLGISRMQLDRYIKLRRNGPPKARPDGRWPVLEWKRWMRETGRAGGVGGDELEDELPRLNAKRLLLVNERLELDNAERRGELLDRSEIIAAAADVATELRGNLYGEASGTVKLIMVAKDVDEGVKTYNAAMDRVLEGLLNWLGKVQKQRKRRGVAASEEADDEPDA
jgi:hypothetical protein